MYKQCQLIIEFTLSNHNHYSSSFPSCKKTPPFLPLNNMTMLQSYFSLFN